MKPVDRLIAKHLLLRWEAPVRKIPRLLTLLCLLLAFIPVPPSAFAATDAERKKRFLRSRGIQTKEKATPKPKATPRSTPRPRPRATPKPKPKPKPASKPKATPRSTPRATPAATPRATPRSTPRATATPAPARQQAQQQRRRPSTPPAASSGERENAIVVEKSGHADDELLPPPPPERTGFLFFRRETKYKYLTPAIRRAIDRAPVKKHRWRYIVIHNSATRQGSAKAFNYYHTNVRKMPNGLAYHFVIGNGTSTGDGQIEIGPRWSRQINGGHVHSDYLNNIALGICFVGDYNRDRPTRQQLEALDELIRYLRRRVGRVERREAIIKAHKDINPRPTSCPGKRFPYTWLYTHFDKKKK